MITSFDASRYPEVWLRAGFDERRVQALMNIMRKIWLKVGHIQGSQMLFSP